MIYEIYTTSEAAKLWGMSIQTIKQNCLGQNGKPPRFQEGEFRKAGSTWLISKVGMERLYGKLPK